MNPSERVWWETVRQILLMEKEVCWRSGVYSSCNKSFFFLSSLPARNVSKMNLHCCRKELQAAAETASADAALPDRICQAAESRHNMPPPGPSNPLLLIRHVSRQVWASSSPLPASSLLSLSDPDFNPRTQPESSLPAAKTCRHTSVQLLQENTQEGLIPEKIRRKFWKNT